MIRPVVRTPSTVAATGTSRAGRRDMKSVDPDNSSSDQAMAADISGKTNREKRTMKLPGNKRKAVTPIRRSDATSHRRLVSAAAMAAMIEGTPKTNQMGPSPAHVESRE